MRRSDLPVSKPLPVLSDPGCPAAAGTPTREDATMVTGTIIRLVRDRGFGFIRGEDGKEVFFHATGVVNGIYDNLNEDQMVTYEKQADTRGRGERAVNVRPA